jgi:hypothetical protein
VAWGEEGGGGQGIGAGCTCGHTFAAMHLCRAALVATTLSLTMTLISWLAPAENERSGRPRCTASSLQACTPVSSPQVQPCADHAACAACACVMTATDLLSALRAALRLWVGLMEPEAWS